MQFVGSFCKRVPFMAYTFSLCLVAVVGFKLLVASADNVTLIRPCSAFKNDLSSSSVVYWIRPKRV